MRLKSLQSLEHPQQVFISIFVVVVVVAVSDVAVVVS